MNGDVYCRLCRSSEEPLTDIFEENASNPTTSLMIRTLLHVWITKNDLFSHKVCGTCEERIHEFHLFAKKCQQTQIQLCSEEMISEKTESSWKMEIDYSDDFPKCNVEDIKKEQLIEVEVPLRVCSLETINIRRPSSMVTGVHNQLRDKSCNSRIKSNVNNRYSGIKEKSFDKAAKFSRSNVEVGLNSERNVLQLTNSFPNKKISISRNDSNFLKDISSTAVSRSNIIAKKNEKLMTALTSKLVILDHKYKTKRNASEKIKNGVKCPFCGESFTAEEFKTDHMSLHTDDSTLQKIVSEHIFSPCTSKIFECEKCEMPFNRELVYLEHMNKHNNDRPFKCHLCSRQFFGPLKVRSHFRNAHNNTQAFKCELCPYVAKTAQDLRTHKKGVHSDERLMCNVCGKLFSAFHHNMKKHLQTHSETRPFKCDQCDATYKTKDALRRHRENIHFPESVMCSLCGTISGSKQKYKKHLYKCKKKIKKGVEN